MNIRPHAQVIIIKEGKLFCAPGYDATQKEEFYRTVGGGIDFGELAVDAIHREIQEEFATELINVQQVQVSENIFLYNNTPGHEIVFIFTADFKDDAMYQDKIYPILDSPSALGARWCLIDDFLQGKKILYPKAVLDYLGTISE